jgi:broad specificity phosphatase PhoE
VEPTGRWQGQDANTLLTERGREQAQVVARRLSSYPIEVIYSSDLSRAFETAQIVGGMLGLDPAPEPGLPYATEDDCDLGRFDQFAAQRSHASKQHAHLNVAHDDFLLEEPPRHR